MSVPDYSKRIFPLAVDLFTAYARNQTVKVGYNNNPVAATSGTPVATGLSVAIKDIEDSIMTDKDGASYVYTGRFLGGTFVDTPIKTGMILESQTKLDEYNQPVRYFVDGISVDSPISARLHLNRITIGA